ncbi:hypothetical protein QG516_06865 [Pedobacter gandavensis]|uniref:hypothetical protein n=1 Tax=Pedobacter gandavensis TaxID=2679963 RepID=UPI0024796D40|nr:hypothetical protein [Pedobacter gandavensis]WGQ11373.1 hypothetical protein QG516_06865 [Pedobacter gandavensis]
MSKYQIVGIVAVFLGIGMALFGASLFTYQGPPLNPVVSEIGMYSFFLWLPTIIVGICLLFIKKKRLNDY